MNYQQFSTQNFNDLKIPNSLKYFNFEKENNMDDCIRLFIGMIWTQK